MTDGDARRPRGVEGRARLRQRVPAAERCQQRRVGGLHAEAHAGDAGAGEFREHLGGRALRVGLDGHFGGAAAGEEGADEAKEEGQRQLGGRAAAEVERARRETAGAGRVLGAEGRRQGLEPARLAAHDGEVAVRTQLPAERDVHVQSRIGVRDHRRISGWA